jgi:S1-C subfamily serine protease
MSRLNLFIGIFFLALASLACGVLPQVQLSFDALATTVPISAPVAVVTPPTLPTLPPPPTALPDNLIQEADAEELLLINIYERTSPSVVSIQAIKAAAVFEHPPLPEGIPTPDLPNQPFPQQGEGSGFVVDTQGHIVTNNHVVADTTELRVTFFAESLRPVTWGNSDTLHVGQRAIAIGNPFGYENTLTTGIISGLSRSLPAVTLYRIPDIIQTDAAINPGNSGGPLLNSQGEVIGVTSAIVPNFNELGERTFLGVGFAIPANLVQRVVPVLIAEGKYEHPWIGFSGRDVVPEVAAEMGLPEARGALVERVLPNSPASRAGLQGGSREVQFPNIGAISVGGDVIIRIDDQDVRHFDDILSYLSRRTAVGQEVVLTVIREGNTETVPLTLGKRPSSIEMP